MDPQWVFVKRRGLISLVVEVNLKSATLWIAVWPSINTSDDDRMVAARDKRSVHQNRQQTDRGGSIEKSDANIDG